MRWVRVLVPLLTCVVTVGFGCGPDGATFQVHVNRQVDVSVIGAIAVLEFGWTGRGSRQSRPAPAGSPVRSPDHGTEVPVALADEQNFQASRTRADNGEQSTRLAPEQYGDDDDDDDDDDDGEDDDDDDEDEDDDDDDDDDDLPGYVRNAGATIADQVASALMSLNRYSVRERSRLKEILDEHDLVATQIVADRNYSLAGGLLSVDALVVGDVHTFSHRGGLLSKVSFSCRCIDTRRGDVLWSMSGELNGMPPGSTALGGARDLIRLMVDDLRRKLDAIDAPPGNPAASPSVSPTP